MLPKKKKIHFSRRIYYTTPWVRIWPGGEWAKRKKKQIKFKTGLLSGCISQHSNYKNTVVILVQSCPTLCDPMDCSPPGSSVHGIFQARILEWVATSFSRGSSWPRDETHVSVSSVSCIGKWIFFFFFYHCTTWEAHKKHYMATDCSTHMQILYKPVTDLLLSSAWRKHIVSFEAVSVLKYLVAACQQCVLSYWLATLAQTSKK